MILGGMIMLEIGSPAPDFSTPDDQNQTVQLSAFKGQWVVLYFYPKAMTPGWTIQAQGVRDDFPQFESANAVVIGCSPDSPKRLAKFREKQNLPFVLASDETHEIAQMYDVWVKKKMFGKEYWSNERSTFLIDPQGNIAEVFRKVKPQKHAQQVLDALEKLQ